MHLFRYFLVFVGCMGIAGVLASSVDQSALVTFQSGATAKASEVNANFEALRQAVNDTDTSVGKLGSSGGNFIPNWTYENGAVGWEVSSGSMQLVDTAGAPAGEKALRNASNITTWGSSTQWIQLDRNLTYRVAGTFRHFLDGGSGTIFLAVRLRDAAGNEIVGDGAWWYYPALSAVPALAEWTHYAAEFGANSPKPFPPNARYATVGFILNYNGTSAGNRTFDVQGLGIYIAPLRQQWTSLPLVTGVSAYGGGYQSPQYRLKGDDVCLRGLTRYTAPIPNGLVIATLPAGFRPPARLIFASSPNTAPARIDIVTDGNVVVENSNGGVWAALDGICFSTVP